MWNRRAFLKAGGLAVFASGLGGCPVFLQRTARAAQAPGIYQRRKVLVAIFQRGAMDGLMAVPPLTDPLLAQHRPNLAMSAARTAGADAVIDLNGGFGLHPAFRALLPYFKEERLAIVHGVGSPNPTRSHFDAQDYMETGTPDQKGTRSGWLNRAVGLLGHEATPFQAVSLTSAMPRSLLGPQQALAIANLDDFALRVPGGERIKQTTGQSLEDLYTQATEQLLHNTGKDSFEAVDLLEKVRTGSYRPAHGVTYPATPLGKSLQQIAELIKAEVGLEVAFTESTGWDTHVQQGTTAGSFAQRAQDLGDALAAFWQDLNAYQDAVTVMTMTEFGRTVRENGSGGTDHGRASCMFVLGNAVQGGQVYGRVPTLAPDALADGRDLPVTTDFRAVFSEVATQHLGTHNQQTLFPGWDGAPLPLWRS